MALSVCAIALLAGCDSASEETPAAGSGPSAVTSSSPTSAAPGSAGTDPAGAPSCPAAATLFAQTTDQPTGVRLTETTCADTWAFIGVSAPGQAQDVLLFEYADDAWRPVDEGEACAGGDSLPAEVVQSVCDAG